MPDEDNVPSGKILTALEELSNWMEKRDQLKREFKAAPPEFRKLKKHELDMANRHVKYYRALAKDMKKATKPTRLEHFIDSLALFR